MEELIVTKASGETAVFSVDKLKQSLRNSGANDEQINRVINEIKPLLYPGIKTKKIYTWAFAHLKKQSKYVAAKYQLKKAIMEFGPSGFPFEKYIGKLFEKIGYSTEVGTIVQGSCITHELDVIASSEKEHLLIECKFHALQGKMSDVKVPLYIHSRYNDVLVKWNLKPELKNKSIQCWVVTNTRFSPDAMQYGRCMGMHLLSWDYPVQGALKDLIDKHRHYPITCITSLTKEEKTKLLDAKIVMCEDLKANQRKLDAIGIPQKRKEEILRETEKLILS